MLNRVRELCIMLKFPYTKPMKLQFFSTLAVLIMITSNSHSGLLFSSSRLALKDLDQMTKLVQDKIKESRKSGGDKSVPLKEALQAVYSRPNADGMIDKIAGPLKDELEQQNAWEHSLKSLVKEATGALRNSKAFRVEAQITYLTFLENLLADLKPKASKEFEHSIIVQVRDAQIEVNAAARREQELRMLRVSESPSKLAEIILTTVPDKGPDLTKTAPNPKAKLIPPGISAPISAPEK